MEALHTLIDLLILLPSLQPQDEHGMTVVYRTENSRDKINIESIITKSPPRSATGPFPPSQLPGGPSDHFPTFENVTALMTSSRDVINKISGGNTTSISVVDVEFICETFVVVMLPRIAGSSPYRLLQTKSLFAEP